MINISLDATEARRISTQLEMLEQQRAQGNLPHENTPLRLYRVRTGGFVRLLDQHAEPISQSMVLEKSEEVEAAVAANSEGDDIEKTQPCAADVDVAPPWEAALAVKTPQELLSRNERVSDWLGKQMQEIESEALNPVDHQMLYEGWPPQLEERRKLLFVPRNFNRKESVLGEKKESVLGEKYRPVIYWMHNTLRVMQGNFGLEAAILLSRRLAAPLVVVSLVPSSIIYPVCHSTTASDAYARFSLVELYQQFAHAGVPFFGITAKEDGMSASSKEQSFALQPNPLYELLNTFEPHAVVTDAMFDSPSRNDLVRLTRYLELNQSSCSWSFLSMDSTSCCPAYQLSMKLQSSLERGAAFVSEEQFGVEYASLAQERHSSYVFCPLPRVGTEDIVLNQRRSEMLSSIFKRLHLEEVNWEIVKAENSQSNTQMRRFTEGEGLQKLSQLLSDFDNQPAIQAELRGGGVLSLLPFIRHGTLFVGYVLRRISEAIVSRPTPTTPEERKALAMRREFRPWQVMRSRAMNHLGKERDYVLYLALWAAAAGDPIDPPQPDMLLLSTSEILASLIMSAPRTSSLETYQRLLPAWAFSAARIGEVSHTEVPGAALYDPYELESSRTKDLYWNEIQNFIVEQQYLHPMLIVYWAYRLLTWSVSSRSAIATIESLLSQCVLGSKTSPDAAFIVWKQLFRLGSSSINPISTTNGTTGPKLDDLSQFKHILEGELASQPKLQIHP
ncbi:hypothetical protein PHMEG_00015935 [Phytophthora megakarya]|uniref:Photolyase/cryptochrome alpha/beta domain-containing protein n=1 Tax=Phytophthora megakarya TaxID=4795 RepID=A0A225W2L6_9STRA|nr:hypothetical protein PHMEG_00015935 [Phytophthora megakarya]